LHSQLSKREFLFRSICFLLPLLSSDFYELTRENFDRSTDFGQVPFTSYTHTHTHTHTHTSVSAYIRVLSINHSFIHMPSHYVLVLKGMSSSSIVYVYSMYLLLFKSMMVSPL
jgi:hypothetical protein